MLAIKKAALLMALLGMGSGALITGAPVVQAAAVPKLEVIRVALFIDTGKYSAATSAVTLASEAGLHIGLRGAGGAVLPLTSAAAKEPVRLYADGYTVKLPETGDAAQAKTLAQKLEAGGADVAIVQRTKQGKAAWQVYLGPYATKEAATAAAKGQAGAVLGGPLRWHAGTYASETEAQTAAAALAQAGFEADAALLSSGAAAAPAYAVLIGGATDEAALQALKAQLATAAPNVKLQPLDAAAAYVLLRSEQQLNAGALEDVRGLAFGGTSAKLWAAPAAPAAGAAAAGVNVRERSNRTYRGGIELSKLNGKLAVINELPFEQYLYSVLGSELSKEWPAEALKAQAVAARTYALKQGVKYTIANVTDTTLDQAYKGLTAEFPAAVAAVTATEGEVLTDKNGLVTPVFYSNAGGMTADPTEVWGNPAAYLKSTASPDDGAAAGKKTWYRMVLPNGQTGYIHSDYARNTGRTNPAGLPYYESTTTGVNVRSAPFVDNTNNPALFQVNIGDQFVVIDEEQESNAYAWIRVYEGSELKDKLNAASTGAVAGSLHRLEVTKRGPSGRVMEITANGKQVKVAYPDALRTALGGLPSTRFEIEETGRYTILGANGTVRAQSPESGPIYIASGSSAAEQAQDQLFLLNAQGEVRLATKKAGFIIRGTGFGHGLGMSQWGAKGYAELGFNYQKILQTYYVGVSITKG
ncbi:SpoIID/LytB domain-containing protein [Paenibacillus sp. GD4]|uniref:SpoIID/LytB domain-containing protein n=1 Tax=Paenibacillus sp. GD4 TaxID=3068890 RepID=UPI002796CD52|nr:SpoIID/LytB domain-containing protein [Paenibacillus sp. GD4]MDQ1912425.1 SpoIID/LytB domain-containing protein [Paenibacillus sp. GD4]